MRHKSHGAARAAGSRSTFPKLCSAMGRPRLAGHMGTVPLRFRRRVAKARAAAADAAADAGGCSNRGELRLVLLKLIADEPRHGYDLIRAIEDMTGGEYAPSPGSSIRP